MSDILLSGFGVEEVNGYYSEDGTVNGYPLYSKDKDHFIVWMAKNGAISNESAYYITKVVQTEGAVPIKVYCYKAHTNSIFSAEWESLRPEFSEENEIGEIEEFSDSSDSSS